MKANAVYQSYTSATTYIQQAEGKPSNRLLAANEYSCRRPTRTSVGETVGLSRKGTLSAGEI